MCGCMRGGSGGRRLLTHPLPQRSGRPFTARGALQEETQRKSHCMTSDRHHVDTAARHPLRKRKNGTCTHVPESKPTCLLFIIYVFVGLNTVSRQRWTHIPPAPEKVRRAFAGLA